VFVKEKKNQKLVTSTSLFINKTILVNLEI